MSRKATAAVTKLHVSRFQSLMYLVRARARVRVRGRVRVRVTVSPVAVPVVDVPEEDQEGQIERERHVEHKGYEALEPQVGAHA